MKKIQNINITEEDGSSSNETKSRFKEYLLKLKFKRKPSTIPKEEPPKKTKLTTIGGVLLQPNIVNEKKPKVVKPKKIIITPPIIDFSKSDTQKKNIDKQRAVDISKKESILNKEEITNKEKIDYLNNQIVNKIKKRLVKYLDEIEMLESELYVINTISKDEATMEELNKTKAKVNALINKINSLKEKYKLIKNYVDNELFIDDKDDFLDEDIDYLKQLATSAEIGKNKSTIKKIKEYKLLSLELDVIEAKVKDLNSIKEKKKEDGGWINAGFMVLEPSIIDLIEGDETVFEKEPLVEAARMGQLNAYRHKGFWQCMDTLREKNLLEALWQSGQAPWKIWE